MFNRRNFLKGGAALGAFAATTGLSLRAARAEEAMRLFWFGSPARAERTLAVVALFEAANPGVKILGEVGGNDYWSKLTTMLAGGNAPDMFQLAPNRFSDYAGRGAVIGLDGYLGSTFRTDRLMPDAMKLGQIGDQVMGVPLGINSFAVLYDTVAFANTGLTPPGPDTTWDEFAAMCRDEGQGAGDPQSLGGRQRRALQLCAGAVLVAARQGTVSRGWPDRLRRQGCSGMVCLLGPDDQGWRLRFGRDSGA